MFNIQLMRLRQPQLMEVAPASDTISPFLRPRQSRQQHPREDRYNGDHDQQLNQCESPVLFCFHKSLSKRFTIPLNVLDESGGLHCTCEGFRSMPFEAGRNRAPFLQRTSSGRAFRSPERLRPARSSPIRIDQPLVGGGRFPIPLCDQLAAASGCGAQRLLGPRGGFSRTRLRGHLVARVCRCRTRTAKSVNSNSTIGTTDRFALYMQGFEGFIIVFAKISSRIQFMVPGRQPLLDLRVILCCPFWASPPSRRKSTANAAPMKCPVNRVMPHQRPPDTAEVRYNLMESIDLIICRVRRPLAVGEKGTNRIRNLGPFECINRHKQPLRMAP